MRLTAVTLIALLTPNVAHAADVCVTPSDFAALLTAAAPMIVDSAGKTCAAAGQPLASAAPLARRWQVDAAAAWPAARAAAGRLGKDVFPAELSDEALRVVARDVIASMMAKDIKPASCKPIEGLLREATPLSAGGFARMVVSLLTIAAPKGSGFQICPEPAR